MVSGTTQDGIKPLRACLFMLVVNSPLSVQIPYQNYVNMKRLSKKQYSRNGPILTDIHVFKTTHMT